MSTQNRTQHILGAIMALPFATSAIAQAVAEQTEDTDTVGIEVIQVTAEKRVSTLQETPIAITAINASDLARQNIEEGNDIQFAIPNAIFTDRGAFNIRGVGNNATSSTAESGTGVHVNGVFLTSPSPTNEYYDIQSIEVLRGPQGTLYGRNTTAGVVNIISAKPTDYLEGNFSLELSNFNSVRAVGAINIPISDRVRQRFAFNVVNRDGFTENIATGNDIDGRDQFSIRSTTAVDITDNFDASLFVQYFNEDSNRSLRRGVRCISDEVLGCSADEIGFEFPNSDFVDGNIRNVLTAFGVPINQLVRPDFFNTNPDGSVRINPNDPRQVNIDNEPITMSEEILASLELNYTIEQGTFTSVTAYQDVDNEGQRDFDNANGSDAFLVPVSFAFNDDIFLENTTNFEPVQIFDIASEQFSQEFRFVSSLDSDLNFTAGLYYLNFKTDSRVATFNPYLSLIGQALGLPAEFHDFDTRSPDVETESFALFSEVYYDISDALKLTVGLRYSDETKSQVTQTVTPLSFLTPGFDPTAFEDLEVDFQEFTGKVGLSYQLDTELTDETLFFGTISRGYKAGGLNPGGATQTSFDPEFINSFEVGVKNTLFNRKLQANATAFFYNYKGLQLGALEQNGTAAAITDNTDAEVRGAEFEFVAAPVTGLLANLNLSFLDSEVTADFLTPDITQLQSSGQVDVRGNELPFAPNRSVQAGIQYTHPVSDNWEITYRVQTYWQDEFFARVFNTPTDLIDNWQQTDINIALTDVRGHWKFEAFVKNTANEDSVTGLSAESSLAGRFRLPAILDPRQVGVRMHYSF
jgi:outer membrane receptor protein involved in Fe transport